MTPHDHAFSPLFGWKNWFLLFAIQCFAKNKFGSNTILILLSDWKKKKTKVRNWTWFGLTAYAHCKKSLVTISLHMKLYFFFFFFYLQWIQCKVYIVENFRISLLILDNKGLKLPKIENKGPRLKLKNQGLKSPLMKPLFGVGEEEGVFFLGGRGIFVSAPMKLFLFPLTYLNQISLLLLLNIYIYIYISLLHEKLLVLCFEGHVHRAIC